MNKRFICLFDILGFSNIVTSNRFDFLINTISNYFNRTVELATDFNRPNIDIMHEPGEDAKPIHHLVFSDTILLYSETNDEYDFWNIIELATRLIIMCLNQGFPLRGALTTGECIINSEMILGKPIVEAYLMESNQEWSGCWISDGCAKLLKCSNCWQWAVKEKRIIKYLVPLKKGHAKKKWVINWPYSWRNDYEDLNFLFTFRLPEYKPDWEVERKINNSQNFFDDIKKRSRLSSKKKLTP